MCKVEKFCLDITSVCNLKCKRCAPYAPYVKSPKHYSLDLLEKILTKSFEIIDYIERFSITGGEPLLHPNCAEILKLLSAYKDRCGQISLFSNGTVVPSDAVLDAAELFGDKFRFVFDNYGENISKKAADIDEKLKNTSISYEIRDNTPENPHCGGWVDYGNFELVNKTLQECEQVFIHCACSVANPDKIGFGFLTSEEGILYEGSYYREAQKRNLLHNNEHEYIDLFDDTLTVDQQREKIKNLQKLKSLSLCAYCKGMCDDSVRYIPGEQLSSDEWACVKKGARDYHEVCDMLGKEYC